MRTIVVTGGASGIGKAAAEVLRGQGHRVIVVDLSGGDVRADLSSQAEREAAAHAIESLTPGGIDALVTCAGLGGERTGGGMVSAVNYFGTTRLVPLLRASLARSPDPRVVIVSSSTSVLPYDDKLLDLYLSDDEVGAVAHTDDHMVAYCTGKRALCHWARRTAVLPEWGGSGILLNGIAPGLIVTPLTRDSMNSEEGKEMVARVTPIAVAEYPGAEAIAPLIAFLASAENAYMVGQIVYADGGSDVLLRGERIP